MDAAKRVEAGFALLDIPLSWASAQRGFYKWTAKHGRMVVSLIALMKEQVDENRRFKKMYLGRLIVLIFPTIGIFDIVECLAH